MTWPLVNSPMQPTLQTFIGVFVNNLGIEYSMKVWNHQNTRCACTFSCINFQPALDKEHTVNQVKRTPSLPFCYISQKWGINLHNTLKFSYPYLFWWKLSNLPPPPPPSPTNGAWPSQQTQQLLQIYSFTIYSGRRIGQSPRQTYICVLARRSETYVQILIERWTGGLFEQ